MNNKIKCAKISIDCTKNDNIDITNGGPLYLGFDFYVKNEEANYLEEFIIMLLRKIDINIINAKVTKDIYKDSNVIWNKKQIFDAIIHSNKYLYKDSNKTSSCYISNKKF